MLIPKDLIYDLGDAAKWEYFFPNVDKPLLVIPGEEGEASKPAEEVWTDTFSVFIYIIHR